MSYFIMKNYKLYKIDDNNYIEAYKGDDNNVSPKDFSLWHFNYWKDTSLEDMKKHIVGLAGEANTDAFYNCQSSEDFKDMAIKTMGTFEEFKKIPLLRNFSTYYNENEFDKLDLDIYEVISSRTRNKFYSEGKFETKSCKVIDVDKMLKSLDGRFTRCFAKKGVRGTVLNGFKKRYVVVENVEELKNKLEEIGKKIKCEFVDSKLDFLGKSFYLDKSNARYKLFKQANSSRYYYNAMHYLDNMKIKIFI